MKFFKSNLLIAVGLFYLSQVKAQLDTCFIEKRQCTSENIYDGYKLVIHYGKDSAKFWDYNLVFLKNIEDKTKLALIGMLLNYQDDTSLCCLKVLHYNFNGNEGCRGDVTDVIRYNIQIDALFIINRLCWPKLMELYSCSPILYDTKLKKSINNDPKKIKIVFAAYKKWFTNCKAKGKIGKYFPFNKGRYVWDGGRKSIAPKE